MSTGLLKASNYYNRQQAWRDWGRIAGKARLDGYDDLVDRYSPPADAGWRKIDKCIAGLRAALASRSRSRENDDDL